MRRWAVNYLLTKENCEMDSPITRAEHEEFRRTVEAKVNSLHDEDVRLSKRLTDLENSNEQLNTLTLTVQKCADNIENMRQLQEEESKRLAVIENKDGETWRKVSSYVLTTIIGLILGFVFNLIGM